MDGLTFLHACFSSSYIEWFSRNSWIWCGTHNPFIPLDGRPICSFLRNLMSISRSCRAAQKWASCVKLHAMLGACAVVACSMWHETLESSCAPCIFCTLVLHVSAWYRLSTPNTWDVGSPETLAMRTWRGLASMNYFSYRPTYSHLINILCDELIVLEVLTPFLIRSAHINFPMRSYMRSRCSFYFLFQSNQGLFNVIWFCGFWL